MFAFGIIMPVKREEVKKRSLPRLYLLPRFSSPNIIVHTLCKMYKALIQEIQCVIWGPENLARLK